MDLGDTLRLDQQFHGRPHYKIFLQLADEQFSELTSRGLKEAFIRRDNKFLKEVVSPEVKKALIAEHGGKRW